MAGRENEKRFTDQHPPRPPIQSHHSSSVPSTPYQQPRDLRFGSRSPSPGRGLRDNSPRSVVSEAVGHGAIAQRSQPVVCKFETGAELRKRRIPYVDGGNEELGPPKKGIKKSLDAEEQRGLEKQMDELYQKLLPSDESEDRRARLVKKLDRILNEEWPGNNIGVNVFGSSGNLLSSSDSDVDICITTTLKGLQSMHSIAMLLHKNGMEKVVCRASAKVPIVKCWDPELRLAADLNVNNPRALDNTRMIKTYVQLDPRVRPLAKIIKYWTKRRILNDAAFGGTISSYTWICMILSFLQRRNPPILPSLQKRAPQRDPCDNDDTPRFADDIEALRDFGKDNKETLPELLFYFFRHYGYEFEYSKHVVSVREGRLLSRKEKEWDLSSSHKNKEAHNRLCVEEPFTKERNLGNSADDYAWSGIHGEIRRAFDLLADGCQLDKCCEEYEFPPEEKPIFERPKPKALPTLTRSASQSGRPSNEQGSGRSRKNGNRNQSAQRANNRRASSGAAYNNPRVPFGIQSPPMGSGGVSDYFNIKSGLHEQLFQQWQYLQAQTEALKSQLAAQQQQQQQSGASQSSGRVSDPTGSPRHRMLANGMPSPRYIDYPPNTAPLPIGAIHHYTSRYPQPSPMSQVRTREGGTSTNPSSPSLVAAVPALRRQVHRGSIPEGSTSSIRSQSQPGRSFPHPMLPLNMQQQVHPGYDVSGAMSMPYQSMRSSSGAYTAIPTGMPMPVHPSTTMGPYPASNAGMDTAIPNEYVGYYVAQSPGLPPQFATRTPMVSMPPMTLRDPPPQRQRRVTPELLPPAQNGRHTSRSPSPLRAHSRSFTTAGELEPSHVQSLMSPTGPFEMPKDVAAATRAEPTDMGGPLIVNGSGSGALASTRPTSGASTLTSPALTNGIPLSSTIVPPFTKATRNDLPAAPNGMSLSRVQSLPVRPHPDSIAIPDLHEISTRSPLSPSPRIKAGGNKLSLNQNGTTNGTSEHHYHEPSPIPAPLLSPVAELRTPSPTRPPPSVDRDSPRATANGIARAAKVASVPAIAKIKENIPPTASPPTATKHERKGSAPNPIKTTMSPSVEPPATTAPKVVKATPLPTPPTPAPIQSEKTNGVTSGLSAHVPATSATPTPLGSTSNNANTNPWQPAPTRKGHKKSKSASTTMPANEAERKGG